MATGEMQYVWIIFILRLLLTLAEDEKCGPPPDLFRASAIVETDNFPLGTEVKYNCNFGYYFGSIKRKATCKQNGKGLHWDTEGIECRPVSCGEPESIENGQVLGSRYTYPNSVEYVCNVGYNLKGINVRFCGTDGQWTGRKPSCTIVTCPKPEEVENATVTYSSTVYNSIATYNCYDGLHMEGNNTVKCDAEGNWKGVLPNCKELLCPEPLQPLNGSATLMNKNRNVGSLVVYNCNSDFNLIGNTYAKCLATGKWSFETPKCVSLCSVPKLGRGKMGKFEYRNFVQVKPETKIEHRKKLFLRCNRNFEIPTEEWYQGDVEITCNYGNFEPTPACHPARCRSPPPIKGKGRPLENYENNHESIVLYVDACLKSDIILRNKTAKCNYGKWEVQEARCKNTHCSSYNLNQIAGLVIEDQRYESGEFLDVLCKEGYEKYIDRIACKNGTWEMKSLPCKEVQCNTKELQNYKGIKVENKSIKNNHWYQIVCEEGYNNAEDYILCTNYKWENLPDELCKPAQCNTKELQKYEGIKVENKPIRNNNWYQIVCEEGYNNAENYILCMNYKWENLPDELCKPGDCVIPYVPNGEIKKLEIIKATWYRSEKRNFKAVRPGSSVTHGTEYFIFCKKPYKLQGITETRDNGNSIVCHKKQWSPKPECLLGIKTPATTEFPDEDTTIVEVKTTDITKQEEATLSTKNTFIELNISNIEEKEKIDLNNSNSLKKCIYQSIDNNLIAFLNENRSIKGSHFVHGTHLKFGCSKPGVFRLRGPIESKCENGTWEPHLPSCHFPTKDDDVIIIIRHSKNFTVFPGNLIMVEKNTEMVITCNTIKTDKWPRLLINASKQEKVEVFLSKSGSFFAYIHILNMTNDHSGNYSCMSPGNEHFVIIKVFPDSVKIQCPIPQNPKNGQVFYNSLTYNSEIHYECNYNYKLVGEAKAKCNDDGQWSQVPVCQGTCKHPGYVEHADIMEDNFEVNGEIHYECMDGYRLIGNSTLRCLITGQWTSQKPTCKEIRCPVPHNPENGEVNFYSLTYDSEITYKCRDGYKLIGEARAKCQYDNHWSSTPTCIEIQTCNVYNLIERLPEGTTVAINTTELVTNGTNVTLVCMGDNLIVLGQNYATCLNGLWKTGKIECVYGCYPIQKPENSSLILENDKESYRIGESIIFSCPEDEMLDSDLELIFCLHSGWSDDDVPNCIPVKT